MGKRFAGRLKSVGILPASDDLPRNLWLGPPFGGKSVVVDAGETPALLDSSTLHENTLFEQGRANASPSPKAVRQLLLA